jgi:hypothetical protein
MTSATMKTITAAIIMFALASAILAAPASAAAIFPADLHKAAIAQGGGDTQQNCAHSRFGCSLGG